MSQDGGLNEWEGNKAGAKYGVGYCDAQITSLPPEKKCLTAIDHKKFQRDRNVISCVRRASQQCCDVVRIPCGMRAVRVLVRAALRY